VQKLRESWFACYTVEDPDNLGFWVANLSHSLYGEVNCWARDPVRAEGMAWEELGRRMIRRTKTLAYKAVHEGPNGYVP
jgi:hypothetical protein